MLATLVASCPAQNLGNLLRGVNVQRLPVNVGARVDAGYGFQTRQLELALAGEVLFPLPGPLRCRATLLQATLRDTSIAGIRFNSGAGLDLMMTFARRQSRLWPYVFLGGGLETQGSNFDYALLLGLGLEGRVSRGTDLFGELGYRHSYVNQTGADELLARLGVRFGS